MLAFLKEKLGDLQAEASKFRDKETAEAIVAIMTGCAYADGDLEAPEKAKLTKAFTVNPILKQFSTNLLVSKFNELSVQCEFDSDVGLDACLKEIEDVGARATDEKRIAIIRMGIASAKADGEIEPAERAFLDRCLRVLNVSASEVGL